MADEETTTKLPSFKSANMSVAKAMSAFQKTTEKFFPATTSLLQKATARVTEIKLSADQQETARNALDKQFKVLMDLKTAVDLNRDELEKVSSTNQEAAKLLKSIDDAPFDDLVAISQKMEMEQALTGDEIKRLTGSFDSVNGTLLQIRESDSINNLKQLNRLEFIKDSTQDFVKGQQDLNKVLNEQVFETKTMREILEETGLFSEGGFGDSLLEILGLGGLLIPLRKIKNMVKALLKLKISDITAKISKFFEPAKKFGAVLSKLGSGTFAFLGKVFSPFMKAAKFLGTKFDVVGKFFSGIGKIFQPVMTGFNKVKSVFGKVGNFFSGISKALKPAVSIGKNALKFSRGIPVIGQIISAVLAVFDFWSGFTDASRIAGKAEEFLTFGDKIQAGFSEIISSLTFGFVKAESVFKGIDSAIDWLIGDDGLFPKIGKSLSEFGDKVGNFFTTTLPEFGSSVIDSLKDVGSRIFDGIKDSFNNVFSADMIKEKVSSAFASVSSIFLTLKDKVSSAFTSAIDSLSFGNLNLGSFELPKFDEVIEKVKMVLEKLKAPFDAIVNGFSSLFDDAEEVGEKAKESKGSLTDKFLGFFGGKEEKSDGVVSLREKNFEVSNRAKNALKQEVERQRAAQERTIQQAQTPPSVLQLATGSGKTPPAPPNKQISVEDVRLSAANSGAFD